MPLLWLQRVVQVHAAEVRALLWSFAYFFLVLTAYYILRPLRDEMGIAGGVRTLPWMFSATFATMLCAVPVYGWAVARWARAQLIPLVYRFFTANILIFWLLMTLDIAPVVLARAFFVWISVFNLFVVSVFWTFMADLFRSDQGRRLFGFIAAGGSAGALLGPTITVSLAGPLGPVNLLIVSAVVLEISVFCVRRLSSLDRDRRAAEPVPPPDTAPEQALGGTSLGGLKLIARSPYLAGVALWVFLLTLAGTFLYLEQANIVAATSHDPTQRTRIFAGIDLAVALLTIAVQLAATGRLMTRFGVGPAIAFLPLVAGLGFTALALSPVLATVVIFQAAQRAANFAISNPAREALFTVVSREEKYKAKNVVDTVIFRGGDAVSGWTFAALQVGGLDIVMIAGLTVPVMGLWFVASLVLGRMQERRAAARQPS